MSDDARAFFGRRKGHRLRDRQTSLMDYELPRLRVPEGEITSPAGLFARPVEDVWLEIGFGGGEHLVAQALLARQVGRETGQEVGIIGCEPFVNGVAKLLAAVDLHGLDLVRIHDEDAAELLTRLPDASIGRAFLLYPDPWPKRRQRKRRFVSEETLASLARVLKPGAQFRFATDIDDYAAWTLARVLRSGQLSWPAQCADDWRSPWPEWPGTRYEAKAKREGRTPSYLTFLRS